MENLVEKEERESIFKTVIVEFFNDVNDSIEELINGAYEYYDSECMKNKQRHLLVKKDSITFDSVLQFYKDTMENLVGVKKSILDEIYKTPSIPKSWGMTSVNPFEDCIIFTVNAHKYQGMVLIREEENKKTFSVSLLSDIGMVSSTRNLKLTEIVKHIDSLVD